MTQEQLDLIENAIDTYADDYGLDNEDWEELQHAKEKLRALYNNEKEIQK